MTVGQVKWKDEGPEPRSPGLTGRKQLQTDRASPSP